MDEIYTGCNVPPLVSATNLQLNSVGIIQMLKINRLKNLVGEFSERNTCVSAAGYHILGQHSIDVKMLAIVSQKVQQGNF